MKNIALNLVTPISQLNDLLFTSVNHLHTAMGIDINDPLVNLNQHFEKYSAAISESVSGNLILMLLLLASMLFWLWDVIKKRSKKFLSLYFLCLLVGILFFICIFKFQSWNARLQLPFFILVASFVSINMSDVIKGRKMYLLLLWLMIISAIPFVYFNYNKPVFSYFAMRVLFNKPPSVINPEELEFRVDREGLKNYYSQSASSSFMQLKPGLISTQKKNLFSILQKSD